MLPVSKAIITIKQALESDQGYYESWKASIAMSFKDEYDKQYKEGKVNYISFDLLYKLSNLAADRFLQQLIKT